jgi:antitoxin HicB
MATPQEILKLPYERILLPEEEGGYSAYIAEFEGCAADGETADEALSNLNEAALAWISAEQAAGRSIPEAWSVQEFSGKILLRLPKSIHQQLARQADKEGVSLNQYIVQKLSGDVRQDQMAEIWIATLKKEMVHTYMRSHVWKIIRTRATPNKISKLPSAGITSWLVSGNVGMIEEKR